MRPINNFALHAFAAAVLTAFAATGAAAQFLGDSTPGATGAARDGQTRYLALGDSIPGATGAIKNGGRGGGWIEIQGWDWGETRAPRATFKEFTITKKTDTASGPYGDVDRPLIAGRVPNAGVDRGMKKSGEKGRNAPDGEGGTTGAEAESTLKGNAGSGGAARRGGMGPKFILRPAGRLGVASGDVDGDPVLSKAEGGRAAWDHKNDDFIIRGQMGDGAGVGTQIGKAIGNASTDGDDSAAPAEKRQHGWVTVSKPLDRGAVRVNVKTPWVGCRVGTRYPELTLGGDAQRYELKDVVISGCARESVALTYQKVTVRGWNPETKE